VKEFGCLVECYMNQGPSDTCVVNGEAFASFMLSFIFTPRENVRIRHVGVEVVRSS
jgi:hypothetical protein